MGNHELNPRADDTAGLGSPVIEIHEGDMLLAAIGFGHDVANKEIDVTIDGQEQRIKVREYILGHCSHALPVLRAVNAMPLTDPDRQELVAMSQDFVRHYAGIPKEA